MAYNLRSRTLQQELLDEQRQSREDRVSDNSADEVVENNSDNTNDEVSGSEYSVSSASEMEVDLEEEEDIDLEKGSANQRLLQSRARGRPSTKLKGKNGFSWDTRAPCQRTSNRLSDVQPELLPGPANEALQAKTVEEFWDLLFTREMLEIIVNQTNKKIESIRASLQATKKIETYHHFTDINEIRAYIGVLYYSGLWKSADIDDNRLWDKKNGITLYRCVFSRNRYTFLSSSLRFDDKEARDASDKFTHIRQLWDIFIENCKRIYTPSKKCTVDEQLLSFRGRCGFRMYMKAKPDKYGLKLVTLNDAETAYLIHAIPYLGKTSIQVRGESIPEHFFREVTTPIHGTNRTVTCDNWFTSVPLLQNMLKEPYNMTITGTIRKNKREIPEDFKVASKEVPSTKFCYAKDLTLLSFTPKKHKIVLSSYLHTAEITNGKSNIVLHYNETKGGTDTFDQLCHSYTVKRRTSRWPVRIFYGMLDQAAVNARILLKCKLKSDNSTEKCTAIMCLENVYMYLIKPYISERFKMPTLRRDIKTGIAAILNIDPQKTTHERIQLPTRQRCSDALEKKIRKQTSHAVAVKHQFAKRIVLIFVTLALEIEFGLVLQFFSFTIFIFQ